MDLNDARLTERQKKWFASVREGLVRETGKTLEDWAKIARKCPETKTSARVKWLKDTYGLGVNRAATILDAAFPETIGWDDPVAMLDALWKDQDLRAIYDKLAAAAMALGGTVGGARKTFSAFSRKVQYAAARPHKGALRLGLAVPPSADKRLEAAKPNEGWSDRLKSIVTLTKPSDVDAGLKKLIKQAWEGA
ncbi:hypothetical protein sos41_08040 [Alphaproteobacteria bacterium SO-S41]|nr:hypothetical protein sos41_08040 [Alphaproteobacteria bacterium SO-S41]